MLSLQSSRWSELEHAYGSAQNIPALLAALPQSPDSADDAEPWFTLWSALAHQGDVYSASFAAVPHVVEALASNPAAADQSHLQFPAWVEICRAKTGVEIPKDLREAYFSALSRIPSLIAQLPADKWDPGFLACAMSALAASKGQPSVAEAVLELSSPEEADSFLEWFFSR